MNQIQLDPEELATLRDMCILDTKHNDNINELVHLIDQAENSPVVLRLSRENTIFQENGRTIVQNICHDLDSHVIHVSFFGREPEHKFSVFMNPDESDDDIPEIKKLKMMVDRYIARYQSDNANPLRRLYGMKPVNHLIIDTENQSSVIYCHAV